MREIVHCARCRRELYDKSGGPVFDYSEPCGYCREFPRHRPSHFVEKSNCDKLKAERDSAIAAIGHLRKILKSAKAAMMYAYEDSADEYYNNVRNDIEHCLSATSGFEEK